jgi:PB1 domain
MFDFKFKMGNHTRRRYSYNPSWDDLVSEIAPLFNVPSHHFSLSYLDHDKDAVTIDMDKELLRLYTNADENSELVFSVQDSRSLDSNNGQTPASHITLPYLTHHGPLADVGLSTSISNESKLSNASIGSKNSKGSTESSGRETKLVSEGEQPSTTDPDIFSKPTSIYPLCR